jgi:hypothetical protein
LSASTQSNFLNAYDLNFFIIAFDLRHEPFLMNADARRHAARTCWFPGFAVQAEDALCVAPLQSIGWRRIWPSSHARKFQDWIGGS